MERDIYLLSFQSQRGGGGGRYLVNTLAIFQDSGWVTTWNTLPLKLGSLR